MARPTIQQKVEIDARRRKVASLHLRQLHQTEIAKALGIAQSTVSEDVNILREQWRKEALANIDEHQMRVLAELQEVKRAAWQDKNLKAVLAALAQERSLLGLDALTAANVSLVKKMLAEVRELPEADLLALMGYEPTLPVP